MWPTNVTHKKELIDAIALNRGTKTISDLLNSSFTDIPLIELPPETDFF